MYMFGIIADSLRLTGSHWVMVVQAGVELGQVSKDEWDLSLILQDSAWNQASEKGRLLVYRRPDCSTQDGVQAPKAILPHTIICANSRR